MDFDRDMYQKKAEVLKALAHPIRLCIVNGLIKKGSCNVSHMESCMGVSQSGISQHLARLKSAGIVRSNRCGNEIFYEIANKDIKKVIESILNASH